MLLLTTLLVAACTTLGQGLVALCGFDAWRWWAPALGYASLLIVFGQLVHVPRHLVALSILTAAMALAPLAFGRVRSALRVAAPEVTGFGVLMILLAAIPFFATGRAGVLGASLSNDMS